ncbi:MAG: NusA-like transcription termination signal-binding factor [Nanoarchaeota archaeon]|nr:NusA-like transcription termination signal-binding factor [Nanoarchaeota archaeon]
MAISFKIDVQILQWIELFEKVTRAKTKDCFLFQDKICFMVVRGHLHKALGPNKKNVTKLENLTKRRIKIIEYNDNVLQFITNVLSPLKVVDIKNEEGIVTITGPDQKTRGLMIGAKAANLRGYEQIVQKYFPDIQELKVI